MGKNHDCFLNFRLDGAVVDCNYFFDGNGIALTEDRVVVYNIFLYKISKKVDRDDARIYFEQFGEIKKFHFVVKKAPGRRRGSRVGFIHYKDARAAAKVLKLRCHKLGDSKQIWVKACDSWHQPQGDSYGSNEQENDAMQHFSHNASEENVQYAHNGIITTLDDDCLYAIVQTMSLRDQVNFACSHPRFASVFKMYSKLYYKTFRADEFDNLSLWNIRQFLMFAGQFIEVLTGTFQHKYRDRIVHFIKVHCPNIQTIKLDTTKMKLTSLRKMLSIKPKLTTLNLIDCGISDHSMYAISKLTQLENLVISRSSNFTGLHLGPLNKLQKLRLFCCAFLQSSHLLRALSGMPCLRFLDIRGSEQLGKKVFEKLPQLCPNLEVLLISCYDMLYENIAKIPMLKSLCLTASYHLNPRIELFQQLAKEKSKQLEFLQILPFLFVKLEHCEYISKLENLKRLHLSANPHLTDDCLGLLSELKELEELKISGCRSITNDGLVEMVLQCPKLKWVNIQNTDINNNFAKKLIKHLKGDKRPNGRITFLVAGSKISRLGLPESYNNERVKSFVYFEFSLSKVLTSYDHLNDAFESNDLVMNLPFFNMDNVYQSDSDDDTEDDLVNFINVDMGFENGIDGLRLGLFGDDADMLFW